MEMISRASRLELDALVDQTIDAVFQAEGYWHFFVAIRCTDGQSIIVSTEDVGIAKYFEVFPVKVKLEVSKDRDWKMLDRSGTIQTVRMLWRDEWLAPAEPHPKLVGAAPHHAHTSGRGPPPDSAIACARVQAGIEICLGARRSIVVHASNTAPFNVEFALTSEQVINALAAFNVNEA